MFRTNSQYRCQNHLFRDEINSKLDWTVLQLHYECDKSEIRSHSVRTNQQIKWATLELFFKITFIFTPKTVWRDLCCFGNLKTFFFAFFGLPPTSNHFHLMWKIYHIYQFRGYVIIRRDLRGGLWGFWGLSSNLDIAAHSSSWVKLSWQVYYHPSPQQADIHPWTSDHDFLNKAFNIPAAKT